MLALMETYSHLDHLRRSGPATQAPGRPMDGAVRSSIGSAARSAYRHPVGSVGPAFPGTTAAGCATDDRKTRISPIAVCSAGVSPCSR